MDILALTLLFFAGMAVAILIPTRTKTTTLRSRPIRPKKNEQLDMVDEMFLYGEVSGDDFYDMG